MTAVLMKVLIAAVMKNSLTTPRLTNFKCQLVLCLALLKWLLPVVGWDVLVSACVRAHVCVCVCVCECVSVCMLCVPYVVCVCV